MIIIEAIRKVLSSPRYLIVALVVALVAFSLLILLPVGRLDPAAFYYQIIELDYLSLVSFGSFSLLAGTLFAMEIYVIARQHESKKAAGGRGFFSFVLSFLGGVFGSGICPVCLLVLLNFFGLPTVFLSSLLDYRLPILIGSIGILLTLLYFTSRVIAAHPEDCAVCEARA